MKKLFVMVLLALVTSFGYSQTINDVTLKDINVAYIRIVGSAKLLNPNKVTIDIDFGQKISGWDMTQSKLKDENGKTVIFNSMVDAINFFYDNGYDFVTAYAITVGSQNVYHYLLKKKE